MPDTSTPVSDFAATARRHVLDILAAGILFVSSSILAGRVWRFPFDDELITLTAAERNQPATAVAKYFLNGGDIHPPLSFLLFYGLHQIGWSEASMRLCSLGMTALSLMLFQVLTLSLITQRSGAEARLPTRLVAGLLFGLSPLAIGQGDAIRWYPLFALLFALFFVCYVMAGRATTRLFSAIALGLAASTNFIVAIVIAPLLIYRYFLQCSFRPILELAYWLIFSLFAALGIWSAYSIATKKFTHVMGIEFGSGPLRAAAGDMLGFFGGDALGVTEAWAVLPVAIIAAFAVFTQIDRKRRGDPVHFLLLTIVAMLLMVLPGFGKPRSFLYLAPVLASILTLYFDKRATTSAPGSVTLMVSLVVLTSVGAIANINHGSMPFKRNAVIPYQQILDFIRVNARGRALILTTDPVVVWVLQHEGEPPNGCVSRFIANRECFATDRHYDTVFSILGHSNLSSNVPVMRDLEAALVTATAGKQKVAEMDAGFDEDAAIKSKLTGVPLDQSILSIVLYR